ncbi:MAG: hypothetical protein ACFFDP_07150, partial [Promethearchaeota archaeon]
WQPVPRPTPWLVVYPPLRRDPRPALGCGPALHGGVAGSPHPEAVSAQPDRGFGVDISCKTTPQKQGQQNEYRFFHIALLKIDYRLK